MKTKVQSTKTEYLDPFLVEINKKYGSAIASIDKMLTQNEELQRRMNNEFERLRRLSILMDKAK